MIKTPYYSIDIPDDYEGPIPNTNYKIQDLFCLKTRMYPIVRKILGPEIKISYDTSRNSEFNQNGKHHMFMILTRGGKPVIDISDDDLNFLEKSIDIYTSDPEKLCLVFSADAIIFDDRGRKISNIWIRQMLEYIDLPEQYTSRLDDTGILTSIPENTSPETGYEQFQETYHKLSIKITEMLQDMYNSGYIVTSDNHAKNWDLELVTSTEDLYHPLWVDHKITGDSGINTFLHRAFRGQFQIIVGYNMIIRHHIAEQLITDFQFHFEANYLIVAVNNIHEVRQISSLVHTIINTSTGRILTFKRTRSVWMQLYTMASMELYPDSPVITYQADQYFVFSCLRPLETPSTDEQLELKTRAQMIFKSLSEEHSSDYLALEYLNAKNN